MQKGKGKGAGKKGTAKGKGQGTKGKRNNSNSAQDERELHGVAIMDHGSLESARTYFKQTDGREI